jgi:hypothetical protein
MYVPEGWWHIVANVGSGVEPGTCGSGCESDGLAGQPDARLRRGPSVILPPPFSFLYGEFLLYAQIVVTNDSAPPSIQAPSVAVGGQAPGPGPLKQRTVSYICAYNSSYIYPFKREQRGPQTEKVTIEGPAPP